MWNILGFPLGYMLRCEILHFLFSLAFVALPLVLGALTLTISSKGKPGLGAIITVFLLSSVASWSLHIYADWHNLGF